MRYISIEKAKPGMILGRAVFTENNCILLTKGSELTQEYIVRLSIRGYQGVYIEDDVSAGIEIEEVIPIELRNLGSEAVKDGNIDKLQNVAKSIVEEIINHKDGITLDLKDLRTYDDYTYRHSVNVAVISTIIGMYLEYDNESLEELCLAALLHDLGKTKIDQSIINKTSRLTMEEYLIVQKHARYSYELLLQNWTVSSRVRQAVLHHHENEDGTGYPGRLVGDEIPEYAKILHVTDVYDALTSKRPYKKPYALSESIEYIMGGSNVLFDQTVVDAFLKVVPIYARGTEIELTTGESAIVVANTCNPLRPIIRMIADKREVNLNDDYNYLHVTIKPQTIVERDFVSGMNCYSMA